MRVEHGDPPDVLADRVRIADRPAGHLRGLIGRRPLSEGGALVFRFGSVGRRRIHTLCLPAAIDVVWVVRERVEASTTLSPWRIGPRHPADTIIELPAGGAEAVEPGDLIRLT